MEIFVGISIVCDVKELYHMMLTEARSLIQYRAGISIVMLETNCKYKS